MWWRSLKHSITMKIRRVTDPIVYKNHETSKWLQVNVTKAWMWWYTVGGKEYEDTMDAAIADWNKEYNFEKEDN